MQLRSFKALLVVGLLLAASCTKPGPKPPVTADAVVTRSFDADLSNRFAFARTVGAILTTAGIPDTAANRENLVQSMIASFSSTSFTNLLSGMPIPVPARPGDASLTPAQMLNAAGPGGMIPIGLFNRIDLAPADWSDCGEHRIVYALKPGAPGGRFFLIFEAKLPNPDPAAGAKGCRAVAQRWARIGTAAPAARKNLLEEFYFAGLPGFSPVVHFANYGSFLGQVRSNSFRAGNWELREFRVLPVAPGQLAFLPGPVASNPFHRYYANNPSGTALEQSERTAFQTEFSAAYLDQLRSVDATLPGVATPAEFQEQLFNKMGAAFHPRFNEFQSDAQNGTQTPLAQSGTNIKAGIPALWTGPVGVRTISQNELLIRAGVVTCGGCHQLSNGVQIGTFNGNPVTWPNSAGFVHISEFQDGSGNHIISPALQNFFIPFRRRATDFLLTVAFSGPGTSPIQFAQSRPKAGHPRFALHTASDWQPATAAPGDAAVLRRTAAAFAERRAAAMASARDLLSRQAPQGAEAFAAFRARAEQARAEDQLKPGAFMPFRRPH